MTRIAMSAKVWRFALDTREKECLELTLRAYPAIPRAHQPLSRGGAEGLDPEDTQLLEEALEEHRRNLRRRIQRWWTKPGRLRHDESHWELEVPVSDVPWLLQVLNDVRVGHWIKLGSPEELDHPRVLLRNDPADLFLMEVAGMFQMVLLHCLEPGSPGTSAPE